MEHPLEIVALGGLRIQHGGVPITGLLTRKAQALLCYLALAGVHSREDLAGLLWGEASQANARASLRRALSDLRQALAPHMLLGYSEVALNRALPHRMDVTEFRHGVAQSGIERGYALTEDSAAALDQAVALYRGDFLAGFHVHHAPAFEEWVVMERERLHLAALQALHALAHHYAAREEDARASAYAARMLELEPLREDVHRLMMSLLARSGQRAAALRQYRACRQVLADELGIGPDPATQALYERIRAGPPGGSEGLAPRPMPRRSLPAVFTPLIGREHERAAVWRLLADPACRLLSLVGPGGVGKTHLALAVAADLQSSALSEQFADGAAFASLGSLDENANLLPALADAVGFMFHQAAEPRRQLLDYLRDKRLLLVLDGCENALFFPPFSGIERGKELLTEILQAAPAVKILATSRVRLNLGFEHVLPLAGLDCPEDGELDHAATFSGVRLFLVGAGRVRSGPELEDWDLAAVARICRAVGGLPLAILLAAGWTRALTPAQIAARSEDPHALDFLATDWHDLPTRQRSMRAVFDQSWDLLTPRERDVFSTLSVFRGGFTVQAAWHVAQASARDLAALVDKSLLQHSVAGRYELHDLLRQYAAEKLAEAPGSATRLHDKHCAYYTARLRAWGQDMQGPSQAAALDELASESENARAAWNWAAERGLAARLGEALDPLCYFYKWRGRYHEGERACQRAIDGLSTDRENEPTSPDEVVPPTHPPDGAERLRMLARATTWQGVFCWRMGRVEDAQARLARSQELLEDPALAGRDIRREQAFLSWRLGRKLFDIDRDRARPLYERSLALYRELDDRWAMANVLDDLSWAARYLSDYRAERDLAEESLALRRALGDPRGMSRALRALSSVAFLQGRLAEAEQLIRQSAAIPLAGGSRAEIADQLSDQGWILGMLGSFDEGHRLLGQSVALWRELRVSKMVAIIGIPLGFIRLHLGHYTQARELLTTGLHVAREIGDRGRTGFGLFVLAWAALAQGAQAEADELLHESAALFQELGQRDEVGQVNALSGYVAPARGQHDHARCCLHEALQIGVELQAFLPVLFALPAVAWSAADAGQPEHAVELYALASRYPFVARSRWFEDLVGRRIATVADDLSSAMFAAAQERGQACDLWQTAQEVIGLLKGQDSPDVATPDPQSGAARGGPTLPATFHSRRADPVRRR
jgi:predicted ATPase/DNA-binding SARP family transcriptional activator